LALAGLARVYLARGKLDRARAFAERAVQQAPYQAPYRVLLGDVLRTASESQAAESEYRLASRLNPSKPIDRADRSLPTNPF
jgi:predicted negative regulator of RcsB-dependent stress response